MKMNLTLVTVIALLFFAGCSKSGPSNPITPTPVVIVPVVSGTTAVSVVTGTTAVSGGNITADGGAAITARGVCWNTTTNPTVANFKTVDGSGIGSFTSNITGLSAGTVYYLRSYATNSAGTAYGSEVSFTTTATPVPNITTAIVTGISDTGAISGGNITSDGGAIITSSGVCWSTSSMPTIADSKTTENAVFGLYPSYIRGLTPNTVYYLRAYATNSNGTAYGSQVSFTSFQAIGSDFQGGKLAYILSQLDAGYNPSTTHGLIAAPADINTSMWSENGYITTGATGLTVGTGNANTNQIVLVYGATGNYTAKRCYDLVFNGYNDWYLPGRDEMNKLYLNKTIIGGFSSMMYWTSSEFDNQNVWVQMFNDGSQFPFSKANGAQSRPVRSF